MCMIDELIGARPSLQKVTGSTYNVAYKKLQRQIEVLLQSVAEAKSQLAITQWRQRCLLDLVLHQEVVLQLLEKQLVTLCPSEAPYHASEQTPNSVQQGSQQMQWDTCQAGPNGQTVEQMLLDQLQHPQESGTDLPLEQLGSKQQLPLLHTNTASACSSSSDRVAAAGYTAELLQSATNEEVQHVMKMTAADWCSYCYELFMQLVVLLELINRCGDLEAEQKPGTPAAPAAATMMQGVDSPPAAPTAAASAEAAAAVSPGLQPVAPVEGACSLPSTSLARLEQLVDEAMKRCVIAYMYNHMPLLSACMYNCISQAQALPPPCHWQHVARKLKLTEQQVMHFCIGREEYARLNRAASMQGTALVSTAATPCLFVAAAAEIESRNNSSGNHKRGEEQAAAAAAEGAQGCSNAGADGGSSSIQAAGRNDKKGKTGGRRGRRPRASRHRPAAAAAAAKPAAVAQAGGPPCGPDSQPVAPDSDQAAVAAAEGAAGAAESQVSTSSLDAQLKQHVHSRHLQLRMIAMFYLNTLSRLQIAQMIVSAFPFLPSLTSIATAVAEQQQPLLDLMWQQQQQQQQVEQRDAGAGQRMDYFQSSAERHMQRRSMLLEQQQLQWWEEVTRQSSVQSTE